MLAALKGAADPRLLMGGNGAHDDEAGRGLAVELRRRIGALAAPWRARRPWRGGCAANRFRATRSVGVRTRTTLGDSRWRGMITEREAPLARRAPLGSNSRGRRAMSRACEGLKAADQCLAGSDPPVTGPIPAGCQKPTREQKP